MTNLYAQYIAKANPGAVRRLLQNHGYNVGNNLPMAIVQFVGQQGEDGLREIMNLHPDKNVILELYGNTKEKACNCHHCRFGAPMLNADGSGTPNNANNNPPHVSDATRLAMQTNTIIVAGITMFALTLIAMKLK